MHEVRLFGTKFTNLPQTPKVTRKPSPLLANLSGELITVDLPVKNVQPPIGTGRPGGNRTRKPQDTWPGYQERRKKVGPDVKKNRDREKRMRGGGSNAMFPGEGDFTWYNSRFGAPPHRLEGGGCGGCGESPSVGGCAKPPMRSRNLPPLNNDFLTLNPQYLAGNKCKLRHEEDPGNCSCPPRDPIEATLKSKGQTGICTKSRCVGSDCLIKAFKDAQEFVDGLGKVPGLAGLGIVQGPYFSGQKTATACQIKKSESRATIATKGPDPSGPCGKFERTECQFQPSLEVLKKPIIAPAPAPSITVRKSAVQEGTLAFPDSSVQASLKAKKRDMEKPENPPAAPPANEESPCGSPKCKSRPVKKKEKECKDNDETDDEKMAKKNSVVDKSKSKYHQKNSKSAPGLKMKRPIHYQYDFGNNYPVYGHKHCAADRSRVPAKQGWNWDKVDQIIVSNKWYRPRPGWRPGAISTFIRDQLMEAKAGFFQRPKSAPAKGKKLQSQLAQRKRSNLRETKPEEEEIEDIEHPPTLHIHRKDGVYYVTMYPIRQEADDLQRLEVPINPLQFKIVKSKTSVASSSTASDMEIEFSPPAAVNRLKRKPNVVHTGTQLKQQMIQDEYKKLAGPKKKSGKEGKKEKKK